MKNETSAFEMYLKEAGTCKVLSKEEILKLAVQAKSGNRIAKEKIARSTLKYVISLAKQYSKKYNVSLEELVARGNVGLCIALNKFNPERNFAFTTYARYWINYEMEIEMCNSHDIILPQKRAKELSKIYNTYADSIDDENFNEGSICTENHYNTEKEFENTVVSESVCKALDCLDKQQADIIRMHFGIGCEAKSLNDISEFYKCSREKIRLIEKSAISILKNGEAFRYIDGLAA